MSRDDRHAIVIGAGIAGLLTARVLAEFCTRVTILERDTADAGTVRRGVGQGRHLHGLLDRGRAVLEDLYPGCTAELVAAGAHTAEVLVGTRWYIGGLRVMPTATGLTSVIATRPLLESVLRRRTVALSNVELREGITVRGLTGNGERITGVRVASDGGPRPDGVPAMAGADLGGEATDEAATSAGGRECCAGAETAAVPEDPVLHADLVVDASGRGSRICEWLRACGAPVPGEERLAVDLGYVSRYYRHREGLLDGQRSAIVSTGADGRGGGAVHVEGDRWLVTLAGMAGDHPPADAASFGAYAATLSAPDIHDIVSATVPLGDPVPFRFRSSVRRRFDRLPAVPAALIVLGDAQCAFNPLYAQGMTVAALQAAVLRECLRLDLSLDELPARFYATADAPTTTAWQLAASSDLRHPAVTGRRGLRTRLANAYVAQAQRAAHRDPLVARTFMRVAHLVEPPAALLQPALAARILLRGNGAASVEPVDR
ncbi:FAD-dependent oxidoreductase [Nocardia yunnanensis]|uniref:FAD-dependent oxidoreductase n=1 Tax=Nocardia yunnanensis TaxID=2382165 RepID=A0A386ZB30_9NOCA|nr:FAD-dependent oxidoreductase [Nocardia yunnanensis]AYF73825.1 FAD-dependent oxidoreductase [Nocardia yunnanensis]